MVKEKEKTAPENMESQDEEHQLILHNDDFNTFDFVIETLIEICDHEPEQAEQSAFIVHFKGKCSVKKGTYEDIKPRYDAMKNKLLTVTID